jgi:hypothetical protein
MNQPELLPAATELAHRLGELLRIGVALSRERDINRLLETSPMPMAALFTA